MMLHAHSIRYAIACLKEYDFSQGNEPYNTRWRKGATYPMRRYRHKERAQPQAASLTGELFPMLERGTESSPKQKLAKPSAAIGRSWMYEQETRTRSRLGELLTTRENHIGAKRLFKMLTTIRPDL